MVQMLNEEGELFYPRGTHTQNTWIKEDILRKIPRSHLVTTQLSTVL